MDGSHRDRLTGLSLPSVTCKLSHHLHAPPSWHFKEHGGMRAKCSICKLEPGPDAPPYLEHFNPLNIPHTRFIQTNRNHVDARDTSQGSRESRGFSDFAAYGQIETIFHRGSYILTHHGGFQGAAIDVTSDDARRSLGFSRAPAHRLICQNLAYDKTCPISARRSGCKLPLGHGEFPLLVQQAVWLQSDDTGFSLQSNERVAASHHGASKQNGVSSEVILQLAPKPNSIQQGGILRWHANNVCQHWTWVELPAWWHRMSDPSFWKNIHVRPAAEQAGVAPCQGGPRSL